MGLNLKRHMRQKVTMDLTNEEIGYYMRYFQQIDVENKGFVTLNDIRRYFQVKREGEKSRRDEYFVLGCQEGNLRGRISDSRQ